MTERIRSASPSITQSEIDLVNEAVRYGWQDKMSLYIDQFTEEFSTYVGLKHCLPTAHCTDAIHLAMIALGIGPGDEVIVPDLTWVASASPICYVGAKPVFADVDPISLCITAESIERCITANTKAVVVVDLLGNLPEWTEILTVCRNAGLFIIEDAAEGIGATYNGQRAGTFGDISLFSFNATKLIMSGQGGALCTNDTNLFQKAKLHSHHGIDKNLTGKYYWSTSLGYNYNWTNIQAALALSQLRRIDELISFKQHIFSLYKEQLSDIPGLEISSTYPNVVPTNWINVAFPDSSYGLDKQALVHIFANNHIDLRPIFYPLSSMPPFRKYLTDSNMSKVNKVSYARSYYGICLPNGNDLTPKHVDRVCSLLRTTLLGTPS